MRSVRFFTLSLLFTLLLLPQAWAFSSSAKQAYIVDLSTGTVLYERKADEIMAPSSMTKIMTAYVVYKLAQTGQISMDSKIKVSQRAADKGGSTMFLRPGSSVSIRDLVTGLMIVSGNDAAIALAEGIAGSEQAFASLMNQAAEQLGMVNSHFRNASGWPDPEHFSTARDIAILSEALIREFPQEYRMFATTSFEWDGVKQANRNPLLGAGLNADGLKTGHTEAGGYGLAGSAVQGNRRIIMVLNGMSSIAERRQEARRVMDWALRTFSTYALVRENQVVDYARVWMGHESHVPLQAENGLIVTIPKSARPNLQAKVIYKGPLDAPLKRGDVVGELVISGPGIDTYRIGVEAAHDVDRVNRFVAVTRGLVASVWGDPMFQAPADAR